VGDPVRVLVVEDSRVLRRALQSLIEKSVGLELVGMAEDGQEGVDAVIRERPHVVLMDVRMPVLDGLAATQRIMAEQPTPILLMTGEDLQSEVDLGLRAMEYGALDLISKNELRLTDEPGPRHPLLSRLHLLAGVPVISHMSGRHRASAQAQEPSTRNFEPFQTTFHKRAKRLVSIVSSTGGPSALRVLLSALPEDLTAAVVIVQHIDAAFQEGLVKWLDEESPLRVVLPEDGQDLHIGVVYLAPQGRYVEITERRRLALRSEPVPSGGHCPSGDRLLRSTAQAYGKRAIGVVLTGMGQDGAVGLNEVRRAGGMTLAQDEASSVIFGMPRAAEEAGAVQRMLPLTRIADAILEGLAR
jgi:two-component system, chemotaxis family, protein-glutamate methylesterase/glutaminase